MLYIFDEIGALDDGFARRMAPHLSARRREKISAYRFPIDRTLSAAVYLLLRLALKEQHGIDGLVEFDCGENGKPFLRTCPQIHFNLSHCRRAAACAISDREVGVDVQSVAPVSDAVARRVLTPAEYAQYKASGRPDELFCELWTIKECLLKQTGQGIGADLSALSAQDAGEVTLYQFADYFACVSGASVPLRRVGAGEFEKFFDLV